MASVGSRVLTFLRETAEATPRVLRLIPVWLTRVERSHWRRFTVSFVVGLIVLAAMRLPIVDRSMMGQLDREMMEMAFKIRADLVSAGGDPVMFIDMDDATLASELGAAGAAFTAPPATAPRGVLADVLDYIRRAPPGRGPRVVLVDIDLATPVPGDEAALMRLREVLGAWAADRNAPALLLAREAFPARTIGGEGDHLVLPRSAFDDIVPRSNNIFWVQVKMLADQNNVIREFLPYECIRTPGGQGDALYSAALMAYGFLDGPDLPRNAQVRQWLEEAPRVCASGEPRPIEHGELINYHMSLQRGDDGRAWPQLPASWRGFARCGPNTDSTLFRQLSAADVAAAGQHASHDILCGRLVIVGGTNLAASDFQQTPLEDMAGPMILANAIRGLQMSGGGLARVPLWVQLAVLFTVSLAITAGFTLSRRIRTHYLNLRSRHKASPFFVRISLLPINPLVLNWLFALAAHWTGVALLLVSLHLGYWGYLSAPAFAAAATGAMQEFADDDED